MLQKREIGFFLMLFGYVIAIIAIAYMMLFTTGCTLQNQTPSTDFKCTLQGYVDGKKLWKCIDDKEPAVCMLWNGGISCPKKSRFDHPCTK